jgi:mycothiol synthase
MSITDTITGVIIRPAEQTDQARIQGICERSLDLEPDARDLPMILQASQQHVSVVAEASGEILGVGYGSVGRQPRGHVDLLAVVPAAAGRGVGRRLLAAIEDELRRRGVTELVLAANPPVYVWPGVDVRYTAMTCLAERAGYERFLEAVDMAVDLERVDLDLRASEKALAAAGVTVRRAKGSEADRVVDWLRASPWGQSTWPDEAALALARESPGCHIACRGAEYVGFACHGSNRRGWFGPMGTLPEEQGHGIGAVLLKRCLADMKSAGMPIARIGWVGPIRFYARSLGARVERVYWLYRKTE